MTGTVIINTTNQDKIKYLKRYMLLDREIGRKVEEIARWRDKLTKVTAVYSVEPKGGGSIYGKTEGIIAKIVDLELEVNQEIGRLIDFQQEIKAAIKTIEDPRDRLLMEYRYLDGKSWEQVAVDMNYNYRHTTKLHGRIITKLIMP